MISRNIFIAFLLTLIGPALVFCEESGYHPVIVGKSPLLFLNHPDPDDCKCSSRRVENLYVVDPTKSHETQLLWQGRNNPPQPLNRLDGNTLLVKYLFRLFVVDLAHGKATPVLPGDNQKKLVTIDNGRIFFLDRAVPVSYSYKLESDENGIMVTQDYYKARDRLYSLNISGNDKAELLVDMDIERVLSTDQESFWVITAGNNRSLSRIKRDGTVDRIIDFDSHWVAPMTLHKFSPDKRYLALALLHDKHDHHRERELVVVNLADKRIVYFDERIPVKHLDGRWKSSAPELDFRWINETTLVYGRPDQRVVDVKKGILQNYPEDNSIMEQGPLLEERERTTVGYFDHEFGLLFYKGEDASIATVLDNNGFQVKDMELSHKGEWAAFVSSEDNNTYIVDGKNKQIFLLLNGWSYGIKWLPALN